MQRTTIIAEISGYKQRNYMLDNERHSSGSEEQDTIIERPDVDNMGSEIGAHARIQSL
jgi:hypothetical protein